MAKGSYGSHGGGNRATRVGKYTAPSYYSGRVRTESYRHPTLHTVRLAGGHSARVVKCRGGGS
jgi:hypothetical protein